MNHNGALTLKHNYGSISNKACILKELWHSFFFDIVFFLFWGGGYDQNIFIEVLSCEKKSMSATVPLNAWSERNIITSYNISKLLKISYVTKLYAWLKIPTSDNWLRIVPVDLHSQFKLFVTFSYIYFKLLSLGSF